MIFQYKEVIPLYDFVLIKPLQVNQQTASGLYVVEDKSVEENVYEVVAVGPGKIGVPGTDPVVKKGDYVLVGKLTGITVLLDGIEHRLIKGYDCHAIIKF